MKHMEMRMKPDESRFELQKLSQMWRATVAQTSGLLYRRLSVCWVVARRAFDAPILTQMTA